MRTQRVVADDRGEHGESVETDSKAIESGCLLRAQICIGTRVKLTLVCPVTRSIMIFRLELRRRAHTYEHHIRVVSCGPDGNTRLRILLLHPGHKTQDTHHLYENINWRMSGWIMLFRRTKIRIIIYVVMLCRKDFSIQIMTNIKNLIHHGDFRPF